MTLAIQVGSEAGLALVLTAGIMAVVEALTPRTRTAPEAVEAREEVAA